MKIEWNLPNALTIMRVVLIPVIIVFLMIGTLPLLWTAFALYLISAVTDYVDGALARKLNLTSEFGAFLDPLADKILVISLFIVFVILPDTFVPWWMVLLVVIRDVAITHIRNVFKRNKIKFTTSLLAKSKTVVQMVLLAIILLYLIITRYFALNAGLPTVIAHNIWELKGIPNMELIPLIATLIATVFTYISGADYLIKYKNYLAGKNDVK